MNMYCYLRRARDKTNQIKLMVGPIMIVGLLFIAIIWCLRGFLSYKQVVHNQWGALAPPLCLTEFIIL